MAFDTVFASIKDPSKTKKGDCSIVKSNISEAYTIAAVADGVGGCVCDWKAAQTACEVFINTFEISGNTDIQARISESIIKANQVISAENKPCAGMKTTFSALVYNQVNEDVFIVSIGDSRIYSYDNEVLQQITNDDSRSVIFRNKDGTPLIVNGTVVIHEGVSNVLGSLVDFNVIKIECKSSTSFVLATDGFYNCKTSFTNDIKSLLEEDDLQSALDSLTSMYSDYQSDDMSLIIMRSKSSEELDPELLNELLEGNSKGLSLSTQSKLLYKGLLFSLENKDEAQSLAILNYCKLHNIQYSKLGIGKLVNVMLRSTFENSKVYSALLKIKK